MEPEVLKPRWTRHRNGRFNASRGSAVLTRADEPSTTCPACGRPDERIFLYRKNECEVYRCGGCGLGRAVPNKFDPAAYYGDGYFSGQHADGYADYVGAEPVLRREFARIVDFIRLRKRSGRLLEIGCAYGFFLDEARRAGFEVSGIEVARGAAAHAQARGLNVLTGTVSDDVLRALGPMDVIVLLDVLEHLPEPGATLALCARHLSPGGIIILTTGDFGSFGARAAGVHWRLMTPPQHLWFFTVASLHHLAGSAGLRIEHCDHPWKMVPVSLIAYQIGRMLGRRVDLRSASRLGIPVNLFDAMRVVLGADPRVWHGLGRAKDLEVA